MKKIKTKILPIYLTQKQFTKILKMSIRETKKRGKRVSYSQIIAELIDAIK